MNLIELDSQTFGAELEPFRRELQAHCYRMMGTIQDAEDMVQETFLRAWRWRDSFEGRASLRVWLYKIATNACLDQLKRSTRRTMPRVRQPMSTMMEPVAEPIREPIWLQPYPDELLALDHSPDLDAQVAQRESITLAFVAVLHLLPPRQRAVLLLRDVLGWKAREVADLLDTTESSVKSALFRARATLASQQDAMTAGTQSLDTATHKLLDDYVRAWENADVDTLTQLLADDAIFSMPPIPSWYQGVAAIRLLLHNSIFRTEPCGQQWRLQSTQANGYPAFGVYRREDAGWYHAYGIQVLTLGGGQIAEIITFKDASLLPHFNLPMTLRGQPITARERST